MFDRQIVTLGVTYNFCSVLVPLCVDGEARSHCVGSESQHWPQARCCTPIVYMARNATRDARSRETRATLYMCNGSTRSARISANITENQVSLQLFLHFTKSWPASSPSLQSDKKILVYIAILATLSNNFSVLNKCS
jgi:hypothetical protein